MKLFLRIVGGFFGFLVLAGFIVWVGWLRAPSSESVCENIETIMKKEMGEGFKLSQEECVRHTKMGEFQGLKPYADQMKCLDSAESTKDLEAC